MVPRRTPSDKTCDVISHGTTIHGRKRAILNWVHLEIVPKLTRNMISSNSAANCVCSRTLERVSRAGESVEAQHNWNAFEVICLNLYADSNKVRISYERCTVDTGRREIFTRRNIQVRKTCHSTDGEERHSAVLHRFRNRIQYGVPQTDRYNT